MESQIYTKKPYDQTRDVWKSSDRRAVNANLLQGANQFDDGPIGILDEHEMVGFTQGYGGHSQEFYIVLLDSLQDRLQAVHRDCDVLWAGIVMDIGGHRV